MKFKQAVGRWGLEWKTTLVIAGLLCVASCAMALLAKKLTYRDDEARSCRDFVRENESVKSVFGKMRSVRSPLFCRSEGRHWDSTGVSGTYRFVVEGSKLKREVKVEFRKEDGQIHVERVSMRKGLAGNVVLWPRKGGGQIEAGGAPHVYDGFVALLMAGVLSALRRDLRGEARVVRFLYRGVINHPKLRQVLVQMCLLSIAGCLVKAVLCFANTTSLF